MRFFSQHWKRGYSRSGGSRRSAFGGQVRDHKEVIQLQKRIKAHEKAELQAFEETLDQAWDEAQK